MPNHEKDRHVLAAAIAAEADYLVTENLRDFDLRGTVYNDFTVITADQFLCALFAKGLIYRANILSALHKQVEASRQMATVEDLLDTLERHNRISAFRRAVQAFQAAIVSSPSFARQIQRGERIAATDIPPIE